MSRAAYTLNSAPGDRGFVEELNDRLRRSMLSDEQLSKRIDGIQGTIETTHSSRRSLKAASYPLGAELLETDRNIRYVVRSFGGSQQWFYDSGVMRGAFSSRPTDLAFSDVGLVFQATDWNLVEWCWSGSAWEYQRGTLRTDTITSKPQGLGAADAGLRWYSADYDHTWRWTGTTWVWNDGERRSGEFAYFAEDPGPAWHLCNGATVTRSKSDGTTASITLPNETANVYRKGGAAYTGAVNPGTTPNITGATGSESAHTHSVTIAGSDTASESAHTHSVTIAGGATGAPSATENLAIATTENLIAYSEPLLANLASASGTETQASFTENGLSNGVQFSNSAVTQYAYERPALVAGRQYTLSMYVVMNDASAPVVSANQTSGDFCLYGGDTYAITQITVQQVSGALYRVSAVFNAVGPTNNTGVVRVNTQSGKGFRVTGWQIHDGNVLLGYVKTTGAATSNPISVQALPTPTHTHANNAGQTVASAAGSAHSHANNAGQTVASAAGSAHSHAAGTLALASAPEPPNIVMLPYYRL